MRVLKFHRCIFICLSFLGIGLSVAIAQNTPLAKKETYAEKAVREEELLAIEKARSQSSETLKKLEEEAKKIAIDRKQLNEQLISSAQKVKSSEIRIQSLEARMSSLSDNETAIRLSLDKRRDVLSEVLAILQRMGRKPPPAILVNPEDMLSSVRTAILMGSVLPELREEVEVLIADLEDLAVVQKAVEDDRKKIRLELEVLMEQQQRLIALMEARQKVHQANQERKDEEKKKVAELSGRAQTLRELLEGMEENVEGARLAAAAARKLSLENEGRGFNPKAFSDPARLAPKTAFINARGMLPLPVNGRILSRFGENDSYGLKTRGISLETRARSVVISPADGWVAYSGQFRSFGQMLILNVGSGYYILLAGFETANVEVGQFVLMGEPIASMGEKSTLSPALLAVKGSDPVLYVEFRKENGSIDPNPWWTKIQSEKVPG